MKKLLSLMMALLLFAMPVLAEESVGIIGGADGPTSVLLAGPDSKEQTALDAGRRIDHTIFVSELRGVDTGAAQADAAIQDLVKALNITYGQQAEEGSFGLYLNDAAVLTYGQAVSGEDVYLNSNLLGGTIVVSPDEVTPLFHRLIDMFVLMGAVPADQADELKTVFSEAFSQVVSGSMMDQLALEDLLALDYTALLDAVTVMAGKIEKVEPTLLASCDPAVAGYALSITDADLQLIAKAFIQFVKENPAVHGYVTGSYTDAERDAMWAEYSSEVTFESEEARAETEAWFKDMYPTVEEVIAEAEANIDTMELTGEKIDILAYVDAENLPTFISVTTPVTASGYVTVSGVDESGVPFSNRTGSTIETDMQLTFMRSTLADDVSFSLHAMTFDKDEAGEMIADSADTVLNAVLSVQESTFDAKLVITPDEENVISMNIAASWEQTETREKMDLVIDVVSEYAPAETEIMSVGGMKLPGADQYVAKAETNHVVIKLNSDYAITGVDFKGTANFSVDVDDIGISVVQQVETTDPVASIMAGDVIRPAELDDNAFANWFVGVINGLEGWAINLMMALPESAAVLFGS